jgi:hypothetical protein
MKLRGACAPALILLLAGGQAHAQHYTHLSGLIRDPSGAAVPGAAITATSDETGFRRFTQSGGDGAYVVASLYPGVYKITVRKPGFRTLIRFGVKLEAGRGLQLDFTLPLGSIEEEITVTGAPPLLNAEDAAVGILIERERIERLPLNGRTLLGLFELSPATIVTPATRGDAGQFTASGQRPNAHYFAVDGLSANTGVSAGGLPAQSTGGALPSMTALGSLHSLIPLTAVEEFRIQTSGAPTEFGRLPGAQVLVASRSGSNEFHGSLAHYLRHGALDARDWFANRYGLETPGRRLNQSAGGFGGPLRRNRTFFFLAYEGLRLREGFAWRAAVASDAMRSTAPGWAQPLLSLFPPPNGEPLGGGLAEWTGLHRRRARSGAASLRLDHALTARLTVFARYNEAHSSNNFTTLQANDLRVRHRSASMGLNARLAPAAVLDLKANRSVSRGASIWRLPPALSDNCAMTPLTAFFLSNASCDYLFRISVAGLGQAVAGAEPAYSQAQEHLLATTELGIRRHRVRLGADFRRYSPLRRDSLGTFSLIAETLEDLMAARELWIATSPARTLRSRLIEFSGFGHDTWRLRPELTASIGLRWEYAPAPPIGLPGSAPAPLTAYAFPGQSRLWSSSYGNLAPRAAIAWRPTPPANTVLRAGWGLFYHSTLSIGTDLVNGGPLSIAQFGRRRAVPFSTLLSFGFAPGLRLPAVHQWNVTLEHAFAGRQVLAAGYVGSSAARLLRREFAGGGSTPTLWLALATNHGSSAYHAFQLQYRRPMRAGVQAMAAYSWSHSIDNSSSDSLLHWAGGGLAAARDRGASDFDVRHAFTLALSFESVSLTGGSLGRRLRSGWSLDTIFRARTGFPVTVLGGEYAMGLGFANAFRPDLVGGEPVWLDDPGAPGGRRLNRAAFRYRPEAQGTLGRNAIRGFAMHQFDAALTRRLFARERFGVKARLEAFNLFNHPNFADPARFLSSPLFGVAPSMLNLMLGTGSPASGLTPAFQTGGARAVQLSLGISF